MRAGQMLLADLEKSGSSESGDGSASLVLVFGPVESFERPDLPRLLRDRFPEAVLAGCSTSGEITAEGLTDAAPTATIVRFDRTPVRLASARAATMDESSAAGASLAARLADSDLRHVFLLSDGVHVNGTELVQGLMSELGEEVLITGGLAGDAGRFTRTLVLGQDEVGERRAVAIGFYGPRLRIGYGSMGGWESFGPIRRVTRAKRNVVYEMDGRPALSVYESYLGEDAKRLPGSGLLFPLALVAEDRQDTGLVRTLVSVDRATGALVFAGNVPQGALMRLMHAGSDGLVAGAETAAVLALTSLNAPQPQLAVLVSCVGRRLLLGRNTDLELEAVRDVLGADVPMTGFYSNGEIGPFAPVSRCELHNQTMTITTYSEDA
jgi:hypothetical protein